MSISRAPVPRFLFWDLAALILKLALLKPITKVLLPLTLWSQIYPISMDLFSAPQSTICSATRLHFRELDRECNKEGCLSLSETRRRCLLLTSAKKAERKERRRLLAEYCKESLIIMVLTILFGAFSIQMGLWQGAPLQILISAL